MPTNCKPISKREKTISPYVCQLVANRFQIEGKTILEKPLKWIASGPTRAQLEHNRGPPQQGIHILLTRENIYVNLPTSGNMMGQNFRTSYSFLVMCYATIRHYVGRSVGRSVGPQHEFVTEVA